MKKFLLAMLVMCGVAGGANATVVLSNVSYTANSVTFTATGDLSGMSTPAINNEFGLIYTGTLPGTPAYYTNTVNGQPLSGNPISGNGMTGAFGSDIFYTWFAYNDPLSAATTFSGTPVTLSWASKVLNPTGTGQIEFIWGNGYDGTATSAVLASVSVVNGVVANAAVPEPATVALLGLGLAGLALARRQRG